MLLDALEAAFSTMPAESRPRLVRGPRATDAPGGQPFVVARTLTYAPLPEAPLSKVRWAGVLTIVSKHTDAIRAEDQLEELFEVVFQVPKGGSFLIGEGSLVAYAQNEDGSPSQYALEVDVTSIFNKE